MRPHPSQTIHKDGVWINLPGGVALNAAKGYHWGPDCTAIVRELVREAIKLEADESAVLLALKTQVEIEEWQNGEVE